MLTEICYRRTVLSFVGIGLFYALIIPAQAATSANNVLIISESLSEKVTCTQTPATKAWNCGIGAADNYKISATVILTGVDITKFTRATTFDLQVGNLHISHPLGDDPKYATNKTSATFVSSYRDSKNKPVIYQTVILKWTKTQLTASINGKTANTTTAGWASIKANTYAGDDTRAITDTTTGSLKFGSVNLGFSPLPLTGSVTTKPVKGKNTTIYKVSTVKVQGSASGVPIVGSQGGTIHFSSGPLSGVTVAVPVGALASNVSFVVSNRTMALTPAAGTFSGRVIDLAVAGTPTNEGYSFNQPISITIPFTPDGTSVPVPYYIDTNGHLRAAQVASIDNQTGELTFETFHASPYTWIYAALTNLFHSAHNATTYSPNVDGFQVGNPGSIYNPGGECFGICAFEQWYFREKGGGFYPKYMQDIPLGAGAATIKGQEIIRTRAHDSVGRMWTSYVPQKQASYNLTPAQRYVSICNILQNTHVPTILNVWPSSHAVLAYDFVESGATNGTVLINDPNRPGTVQTMVYSSAHTNILRFIPDYTTFTNVAVIGDGSFQMEAFDTIYKDAEDGFNGNGAAQINVTSHTNGQAVTQRTITLAGIITNGQVVVSRLDITLNGANTISTPVTLVGGYGHFSVALSVNVGTNSLTFKTVGYNSKNQLVYVGNSQKQPFTIVGNMDKAAVLVTLTWDTGSSDVDLYTIDPTGDYSAYYHHSTADGGNLDVDNTSGFGPEHWTLTYANTVRWGQDYRVRVHYYSDHQACTSCDPAVDVRPTGFTVTVLLYEGMPQMETHTYSGVLGDANSSNHYQGDSGPDWADVVTITPVQPGPARAVSVKQTESGKIQIAVPVPSDAECLRIKQAAESQP